MASGYGAFNVAVSRRHPLSFALVAVAFFLANPTAQSTNTAAVLVQAVDAVSGATVPGAAISITGSALGPARSGRDGSPSLLPFNYAVLNATTDEQGRCEFKELPAGTYTVSGRATGYLFASYGAVAPQIGGSESELRSGDRLSLRLRLWKTASVSGVLKNERDEPVAGATVWLFRWAIFGGRRRLQNASQAITDDRGAYRLTGITPGEYVVGLKSVQLTVTAANRQSRIDLSRASASSYRDFLDGAERAAGALALVSSGLPLPPARADGSLAVYPSAFYPQAPSASSAMPLTLGPGDERTDVDFGISPIVSRRITGRLTSAHPLDVANVMLRLTPQASDDFAQASRYETAATMTDATGAFTFLGVIPGEYTIRALSRPRPVVPPNGGAMLAHIGEEGTFQVVTDRDNPTRLMPFLMPSEPTLWAHAPVSVGDRDVTNIEVPIHRGGRISGRFEFEGSRDRPTPDALAISGILIVAAGQPLVEISNSAYVHIDSTGQFTSQGVGAGKYLVSLTNPPAGWRLKAVTLAGQDASVTPFTMSGDISDVVIVLTDQPPNVLTGTVRMASGAPDTSASVIVFPAESRRWIDSYVLWTSTPESTSTRPRSAVTEISVNGQPMNDVLLVLNDGASISGRLTWPTAGVYASSGPAGVRVLAVRQTDPSNVALVPQAPIGPDGTFVLRPIQPGRYRLSAVIPGSPGSTSPAGIVEAATINGRDVRDTAFDIDGQGTLTNAVVTVGHPTSLSGIVRDATGRTVRGGVVLAVPANRALWAAGSPRMRAPASIGSDGYIITNLPPGDYVLGVLPELDLDGDDVDVLESIVSRGIKVTLGSGERKIVDLTK